MLPVSNRPAFGLLTGNALKIFAAAAMLVDHVGYIFFPETVWLRIIGRLAFPIFAFMIAEGCRYTKNRLQYFLSVFVLGVICQLVYSIAGDGGKMNILITFSVSIALTSLLQEVKARRSVLWALLFALAVAAAYVAAGFVGVDYGFWGCMTPVLASVFQPRRGSAPSELDRNVIHVLMLGAGLVFVINYLGGVQVYSLLALPVLLLYSGRRGKWKLKYFFYLFYPLHLAALQGIYWLLN